MPFIIRNEQDIIDLIKEDPWMLNILRTVKSLQLPDCWVCAGFVRSKVWDVLHGFEQRAPIADVDVVYFDPYCTSPAEDTKIEQSLRTLLPNIPWSVKNQARMHLRNGDSPYTSSTDAISKFPETPTAIGARLDSRDQVELTAPCGIDDLLRLIVRPTEHFVANGAARAEIYEDRLKKKQWERRWNKLEIIHLL